MSVRSGEQVDPGRCRSRRSRWLNRWCRFMAMAHPRFEQRLKGLLCCGDVTALQRPTNHGQGTLGVWRTGDVKGGKCSFCCVEITRLQRCFQGSKALQPLFPVAERTAADCRNRACRSYANVHGRLHMIRQHGPDVMENGRLRPKFRSGRGTGPERALQAVRSWRSSAPRKDHDQQTERGKTPQHGNAQVPGSLRRGRGAWVSRYHARSAGRTSLCCIFNRFGTTPASPDHHGLSGCTRRLPLEAPMSAPSIDDACENR